MRPNAPGHPHHGWLEAAEDGRVTVTFSGDAIEAIDAEVREHPRVEVGGKLIGYLYHERSQRGAPELHVKVVHYLDAGPGAVREPCYHLPDGPYQERLYRTLEAEDPALEHLGTWHSHHPNGCPTLSQGDIDGYIRTIEDPRYQPPIFLATLVTTLAGFASARHYLFASGQARFVELDPSRVRRDYGSSPWPSRMAAARRATRRQAQRPALPPTTDPRETPRLDPRLDGELASLRAALRDVTVRQASSGGQRVVGQLEREGTDVVASILYPSSTAPRELQVAANVGALGGALKVVLPDAVNDTAAFLRRTVDELLPALDRLAIPPAPRPILEPQPVAEWDALTSDTPATRPHVARSPAQGSGAASWPEPRPLPAGPRAPTTPALLSSTGEVRDRVYAIGRYHLAQISTVTGASLPTPPTGPASGRSPRAAPTSVLGLGNARTSAFVPTPDEPEASAESVGQGAPSDVPSAAQAHEAIETDVS